MRKKIVLIDGHSILNRAFYGVSGSNAQLLGGTVNYLCNGEKTSAAVQTKSLQVKYLTLTDRAANIWTAICVFTLPLLFIIAGLAVWASRRKR